MEIELQKLPTSRPSKRESYTHHPDKENQPPPSFQQAEDTHHQHRKTPNILAQARPKIQSTSSKPPRTIQKKVEPTPGSLTTERRTQHKQTVTPSNPDPCKIENSQPSIPPRSDKVARVQRSRQRKIRTRDPQTCELFGCLHNVESDCKSDRKPLFTDFGDSCIADFASPVPAKTTATKITKKRFSQVEQVTPLVTKEPPLWWRAFLRVTSSSTNHIDIWIWNRDWEMGKWETRLEGLKNPTAIGISAVTRLRAACRAEVGDFRRACALYKEPYAFAFNNHAAIVELFKGDLLEIWWVPKVHFVLLYSPPTSWMERIMDWKNGRVCLSKESWDTVIATGICHAPKLLEPGARDNSM
ncbi:hypothetical protein BJ508DRAFT_329649 [Ascobolus immersus RN42]|uniref:Uncharacterized protein n=1 Tax=Ascobolus immersus RN42 TaxID=1160509 RepID=A0A3N4HVY2_ASCIM|nr:hypothetical protein BJ508DRAFT_329649 [Ascobolus immersus RN42]